MARIRVRRVYEEASPDDGTRILVDRVWPRGVRKEALYADDWVKDAAPSTALRTWYAHDPDRFAEFSSRYEAELGLSPGREAVERLRALARTAPLTLLTATKDVEHSQATALARLLEASA